MENLGYWEMLILKWRVESVNKSTILKVMLVVRVHNKNSCVSIILLC